MRRKSLIDRAIRRRFAVTLTGNEGVFTGVLTDSDPDVWVFEDVTTTKGEPVAGRVYIERLAVAYLQELGSQN